MVVRVQVPPSAPIHCIKQVFPLMRVASHELFAISAEWSSEVLLLLIRRGEIIIPTGFLMRGGAAW